MFAKMDPVSFATMLQSLQQLAQQNPPSGHSDSQCTLSKSCADDIDGNGNDSGIEEDKILKKTSTVWENPIVFETEDLYAQYIKRLHFSAHKTSHSEIATHRYLRCNLVKKIGPQCAARLCARTYEDATTWIVYSNGMQHTHETIRNKMPPDLKTKLMKLRQMRVRPEQALRVVEDEFGEKSATLRQVYYVNRLADQQQEANYSTLGDLTKWIATHSTKMGDDDPFIVKSFHSGFDVQPLNFQYVVTTPRLIRIACSLRIACTDGTYRVNKHNYPVIVLGGIDGNQKMHVIAFSVTTNEATANYRFLFEAIKEAGLQEDIVYSPRILISDAANAILNGYNEAFPDLDKKHVTCWYHVKTAIVNRLKSFEQSAEIISDIDKIHFSYSHKIFKRGVVLFFEKWEKTHPQFCQYLRRYWIDKHNGWYEGHVKRCPSTNNGNEGFNSVLKKCFTYRQLLPLGTFNAEIYRCLSTKSKQYPDKDIPSLPIIDTKLWNRTLDWVKTDVDAQSFKLSLSRLKFYYRSSKASELVSFEESIERFVAQTGDDFDSFFNMISAVRSVEFCEVEWLKKSTCTCPFWSRKGICKHVVGTAYKKKLIMPPPELNRVPLKMPNKKLTRRLAVEALQLQPGYEIDLSIEKSVPSAKRIRLSLSQIDEIPETSNETFQSSGESHMETSNKDDGNKDDGGESNGDELDFESRHSRTKKRKRGTPLQPICLDPGTIFVFGSALKTGSCGGQWKTDRWTELPRFLSNTEVNKIERHNASYVHIGGGKIFMSGGIASAALKRVRFFASPKYTRFLYLY